MSEPSEDRWGNPAIRLFEGPYRKDGLAGVAAYTIIALSIGWVLFPLLAEKWHDRLAIVGVYVAAAGAVGALSFGLAPFVAPVVSDAAASVEAWRTSFNEFVVSDPFMASIVVFLVGLGILTVSAIAGVIDR